MIKPNLINLAPFVKRGFLRMFDIATAPFLQCLFFTSDQKGKVLSQRKRIQTRNDQAEEIKEDQSE